MTKIYWNSLAPEITMQIQNAFNGMLTPDGTTITVDGDGVISAVVGNNYELPTASTTVLGGVKVDGTTITIDTDGVIKAIVDVPIEIVNDLTTGGTDKALSAEQGKTIKSIIDNMIQFTSEEKSKLAGIEEGANQYTLPIASTQELGGVKVDGTTVTIAPDGTITAPSQDTMPTIKHFFTTKIVDPLDSSRMVYQLDFDRQDMDFLVVYFNDVVINMNDFEVVDMGEGTMDYIRLKVMTPVDYEASHVHGFLCRGFNVLP